MRIVALAFMVIFALSTPVAAAVVSAGQAGFEIKDTAHVAAKPSAVYAALVKPGRWWSSEHTYSGNASNMSMVAKAGGCWCEKLPGGGSVQHMAVVFAKPGQTLRLTGGLGPLQAMAVAGVMTWELKDAGGGTDLAMTYAASGYSATGFGELSKAVDGVLAEQFGRLKRAVETNKPDATARP